MPQSKNNKNLTEEQKEEKRKKAREYYKKNRAKILKREKELRDKNNFMEEPGSWMPPYNLEELELISTGEMKDAEVAEMCGRSKAGVASKRWRMEHPEYVRAYNRAYGRGKTLFKKIDYSFELGLKAAGLWDHWKNRPKHMEELDEEGREKLRMLRQAKNGKKADYKRVLEIIKNSMGK